MSTAISTAIGAPTVSRWLRRQERLDLPNSRSSHSIPTPRGGGLACALGAVVGTCTAAASGAGPSHSWLHTSAILGSVGWADDLVGLPALPRLGAQVASGAYSGMRVGGARGLVLGSVTVPAVVNAFNFMDGINGISGGTAAAWGLCMATDPALLRQARVEGCLTAGMGLGFLPFNVPKASMFLGDVGSYLFGAGIAGAIVNSAFATGRFSASSVARSAAPLAIYLADTGSTIVRRMAKGRSLTEAHRDHTYQRLVSDLGWEHWQVSLIVSALSAGCGIAGRSARGVPVVFSLCGVFLLVPAVMTKLVSTGEPHNIASGRD